MLICANKVPSLVNEAKHFIAKDWLASTQLVLVELGEQIVLDSQSSNNNVGKQQSNNTIDFDCEQ